MAGARHDKSQASRGRRMTYWKCSTGLPPSGPREAKALVCQWSSKGCVAKPLSLIYGWNTHTSVLYPWISPDKCHPAVSNSNVTKKRYAWWCDFCLAWSCVRDRCIASHWFEIWNNCYLSELVSHGTGACEPLFKLSVVFFSRQSAGFLEMERAIWNIVFENWWDLAHVCRG